MMRFYGGQHRFYCGIDLHARSMPVCVLDHAGCGAGGNALDLWVAVTRQPLYAAVIDLYLRLGRAVP